MPTPAALLGAARGYLPQASAFLRALVQTPSVNGSHNEAGVAGVAMDESRRLGLDGQWVASDAQRPNFLARYGQGAGAFALIAHLDTVAPGDLSAWRFAPFGAEVQGGRLYGRGAADNKAGLACGLYTLALLRDGGWLNPLTEQVLVAGVVDEESGASSPLGVRYLLDNGHLPVQGAIYTYTSDIICIGHRGLLRYRLVARGKSIHSGSAAWSRGEGGVNAATGLARALLRLETLLQDTGTHPAFPGLRSTITPGTLLQGGEYESMVPAQAEAMVDVRLLPGLSGEEVLRLTTQALEQVMAEQPGLQLSVQVKNNLPAAWVSPEHPLVNLAKAWTLAITGREWQAEGAGPANEGYMLIQKGIPTLCGFGPGGGNPHAADEWVDLESLPATMAMYAGIILNYLRLNNEV